MATSLHIVKLALSGLSPAQLVERARAIVLALTGNADFPTPAPALVDITAATDALEEADAAVLNNGGRQDRLACGTRMQELHELLVLLGAYVQVTSTGDPEKILSSGYRLRKSREPVGPMGAPANLRAEASKLSGVIDLTWNREAGRMFYEGQIATADPLVEANWKALVNLSNNRYTAQGLSKGTAYFFRVRAVGAAGPGPWSDLATEQPR